VICDQVVQRAAVGRHGAYGRPLCAGKIIELPDLARINGMRVGVELVMGI